MMGLATVMLFALAALCSSPSYTAGQKTQVTRSTLQKRVISVPAGYTSCTIEAIPPQDLSCEKPIAESDPIFIGGTEVKLDKGELQKCRIEARKNTARPPLVACLAVPPIIILDPIIKGQGVQLPYGAVGCTATSLGDRQLIVECESPKPGSKERFFRKGQRVDLPDKPFERCTIFPTQAGAQYNCTKLSVIPLTEATLIERTLQVPGGAAKCIINNLVTNKPSSVTCIPPMEGSDEASFSDRTTFTLPDGEYASCQVIAVKDSEPEIDCDSLPYLVVGDILVSGQEILLPAEAALCMATSFKDQPIVSCIPAPPRSSVPKFPEDLRVNLPEGDFGRCIITPDKGAECDGIDNGLSR